LRLPGRGQRRGDLHPLPAQEDRRRGPAAHPHGPRRRVRAPPPQGVSVRLSLRTRVLAATLVLMTVGLAVAGVVTYAFLKSFLLHRVDQQLVDAEFPATNALKETLTFGHPDQGGPQGLTPTGTYCAFLDSSGKTLVHAPLGPYTGTPAAP